MVGLGPSGYRVQTVHASRLHVHAVHAAQGAKTHNALVVVVVVVAVWAV